MGQEIRNETGKSVDSDRRSEASLRWGLTLKLMVINKLHLLALQNIVLFMFKLDLTKLKNDITLNKDVMFFLMFVIYLLIA